VIGSPSFRFTEGNKLDAKPEGNIGRFSAVSLFAGAGGMDLGFLDAGFDILWANDFDSAACETYRHNISDHITCGDIGSVDLSSIPYADVIFGGPPCQGFSVAGKMDPYDTRSRLVWEFVKVVQSKRPAAFVMENVRALGQLEKWGPLRDALLNAFQKLGYTVEFQVLNAADYGVPQNRQRVFFIGSRIPDLAIKFPTPTHENNWVPCRVVLSDLPEPGLPGNEGPCVAQITLARYPVLRRSPYAGMIVNGQGRPINLNRPAPTMHASMGGNKTPIIDLEQLRDGTEEPWDIDYHRRIMAGGVPGEEDPPNQWRRITVREAARIQSFRDDFQFSGSRGAQFRQIGNAVSPPLANAVALSLYTSLKEAGQIHRLERDELEHSPVLQLPLFAT